MSKYQKALNTITDWFSSYTNDKGITVHERHITDKYQNAVKTLQELINKVENGTLIEFPRMRKRKGYTYPYRVEFVDEDGDVDCYVYKIKEEAEAMLEKIKTEE